jgi:YgiT-type zinc finger domain-containing protein
MKMGRIYHKCHFCGGDVVEKKVTVDYRWGEELLVVLKGVPAGVCQVCGEKYFKAEVVKKMEQTAISSEKVEEKIQIPILELMAV